MKPIRVSDHSAGKEIRVMFGKKTMAAKLGSCSEFIQNEVCDLFFQKGARKVAIQITVVKKK